MARTDDRTLNALAARLGAAALRRGQRIVTAESCTGGFIAKALTDVPGSSQWFDCGFVTYSNAAKQRDLGVPAAVLEQAGAVSEPVVKAMVLGALRLTGANLGVAVSGIAGPDGGTADKPVGTVWIAWARRRGSQLEFKAARRRFKGSRDQVRRRSVLAALRGLWLW